MSEEDGPRGRGRLTAAGAVCVCVCGCVWVVWVCIVAAPAVGCAGGYEKEDGPVKEDEDDRA